MPERFSQEFVDARFAARDYSALVELLQGINSTPSLRSEAPDHGLPECVFVFVEATAWFATGIRSGAWTYYEATPPQRQQAMLLALGNLTPPEYARRYRAGMERWAFKDGCAELDQWLDEEDEAATSWLWDLATTHRAEFERLL